jgi:hypothetical protein
MKMSWCSKHSREYHYFCPECSREAEINGLEQLFNPPEKPKESDKCPICSQYTIKRLGVAWYCSNHQCRHYRLLKRYCKVCNKNEAVIPDSVSHIVEYCQECYEKIIQNRERGSNKTQP